MLYYPANESYCCAQCGNTNPYIAKQKRRKFNHDEHRFDEHYFEEY